VIVDRSLLKEARGKFFDEIAMTLQISELWAKICLPVNYLVQGTVLNTSCPVFRIKAVLVSVFETDPTLAFSEANLILALTQNLNHYFNPCPNLNHTPTVTLTS